MAGAFGVKKDPKKNHAKNSFGNESLFESSVESTPTTPAKISLRGILGIGQTIEINKSSSQSKENFIGISHIQHEQSVLFDQRQRELTNALKELRKEIASLAKSTTKLEKTVENIVINEIVEASEYQINFLIRIRNFIMNVKQSISETGLWVQSFAAKKKKKNYFWNKANDKKKGGTQFMFNDESSVARSIG